MDGIGCRPGKSTSEHLFLFRMLQEYHRENKKNLHAVSFVDDDLEKANDRVPIITCMVVLI